MILLCACTRVRTCGRGSSPGSREAAGALNLGWGPRETWESLAGDGRPLSSVPLMWTAALTAPYSGEYLLIRFAMISSLCSINLGSD